LEKLGGEGTRKGGMEVKNQEGQCPLWAVAPSLNKSKQPLASQQGLSLINILFKRQTETNMLIMHVRKHAAVILGFTFLEFLIWREACCADQSRREGTL
jgi:hypothetical protein